MRSLTRFLLSRLFAARPAWQRVVARLGLTKMPAGEHAPVHRRVRLAMYSMLLLVGVVSAWQTWRIERSETVRQADGEVIYMAATQSTLTQRMGMMAALLVVADGPLEERGNALAEALQQAQAQAPLLEDLLRQQGAWRPDAAPALRQAIADWQESRERLWYRGQLLLWHSDRQNAAKLVEAVRGFQQEVEPALQATQLLLAQVEDGAQRRARAAMNQMELSALFMLLVLLVLVLGVVEPLVRFVRRQHQTLVRQAVEVRRLALVARRTVNWVAVLDAQRRVVWCNQAFLKAKGTTLDQMVGQFPGLLVGNQHISADEVERLRGRLIKGEAVRAELMCHTARGQDVWLDVDYQPIHEADGTFSGFTVVATNITERVEQRLKMQTLLDALPAGVLLHSDSGELLECNRAANQMLCMDRSADTASSAVARESLLVREDLTPLPLDERPAMRTLQSGQGVRGESVGVLTPEGALRWLMVNTEPLHDLGGHLNGVLTCAVDVTEQRAQQQLLTLATEGASMGLWQWEIATGTMSCNDRLLQLFGYERGALGMTVEDWNAIIHPDDLDGWRWAVQTNLRDSQRPLYWEVRVRHGVSGRWTWMMYSGTVVARDAQGRAVRMAGICYDIHAQKELEERLRQAAQTDSLTQLPNRSELLSRIHTAIQRARQEPEYHCAVLFMDFDRFKQINDTLGHTVGDELLRQIARRLQDSLRPSDAFVHASGFTQMAARIGGDEFVVLLDHMRSDQDAQVVAARLLEVLSDTYEIGSNRINSSASIGVVTTEHMAEDADSVLRDADIAMYEAKREGRGRYVMFDPSMRKRLRDDVSLENDLRQALELGELHVVYQPLIDLRSGALAGLEALVRWHHPQRGAVSPVIFVPIAEANGMIDILGRFVLDTACKAFMRLQVELGELAPATVSVNLSRAQLRQVGLVDSIAAALRASGMAPGQLILEVTESLAAQDDVAKRVLEQIRALGVALSLDDFGTGYSSLSCLHELPVDVVKIDQSFVAQALHSDYHRVMIEATIRMAQTLGLGTVAEGIETEAQETLMRVLGCGKGQGYLYSPPLRAEALVQWASQRCVAA
jgi:diguanylate cyclase (GGDEF)-like protein/PAS domain S-box-containing protein